VGGISYRISVTINGRMAWASRIRGTVSGKIKRSAFPPKDSYILKVEEGG